MEDDVFAVGYFQMPFSSNAFSWPNWEQYLELIIFLEGTCNKGLPSNPPNTQSPSLDEDQPLV